MSEELKYTKEAHATESEKMFAHVTKRATLRGMVVNESKTGVLCVSDAISSANKAYIKARNEKISNKSEMKILGFTMTERPEAFTEDSPESPERKETS